MNPETNPEKYLLDHYMALDDFKSDFRNHNLFNLVASYVKGDEVVDIGCGIASLANILMARGKKVIGIEPNDGLRALAAKINPKITIMPGIGEDIDTLVKEPVDAVLMVDVLEHVENDVGQVKKICSVLKPGGDFIFVVPCHPSLYGKRDKFMGHYRRYSKKMLKKLLTENGFYIEKMRYWNILGFLPYIISEKILRKPLNSSLRQNDKTGWSASMMRKFFDLWFRFVENNFDFGSGLSIIGIARKQG